MQTLLAAGDARRWLLVLLLLASATVFAIGVAIERSQAHHHAEKTGTVEEPGQGESQGGLETGTEPDQHAGETGAAEQPNAENSETEKLFGVDTESVPIVIAVVALSAALALAVLLRRPPPFLLVVALVGFLAMAFDIREAVHQADESRTAVLTLASIAAALHLTLGLLAAAFVVSWTEAPSS